MMLQKNPHFLSDFQKVHDFVLSQIGALDETESVALYDLVGRVLAEDIISPIDIPSCNQSAMDGFAFRFQNGEEPLLVVDTIYAGDRAKSIAADLAVRVMTGSCLPEGFDTVLPFEQSSLKTIQSDLASDTEYLIYPSHIQKGRHVKQIGDDVQQGAVLLKKGHQVCAKDIGLIASLGIANVEVLKNIKVVILASGSELLQVGEAYQPGMTYDANSHQIAALCKGLPVEVVAIERLEDNLEVIRGTIESWLVQVDVIVTLGGASTGYKDYIKQVFAELNRSWSWKLAMKPAKPFSFAKHNDTLLFALPGNPLAAFMSFKLFVVESLQKLAGKNTWIKKTSSAKLLTDITTQDKTLWMQVIKDERGVKPIMHQSSSRMQILTEANGFIRLKPHQRYQTGDNVEYWEY